MKLAWKQILVAFVIGAVAGVVVSPFCMESMHKRMSGHMKDKMLSKFDRELKLTPDQKQKVSAILDSAKTKFVALKKEMRPKFDELRAATRAEIRVVLTPEQQAKFDVIADQFEKKIQQRREKWSGAGEPGGPEG